MATTGTGGTLLYEGKAKKLFASDDPNALVMRYKDDATAFDGTKHAVIAGKGALNNAISAIFFARLEAAGVPTHYIRRLSELECLVRRVTLLPLEVIVRNRVAGSMARRYGLEA